MSPHENRTRSSYVDGLTIFRKFWKGFVVSSIPHISAYKQGNYVLQNKRPNRETLIGSVVLGVALFQHERRRSRQSSLTLIHCSTQQQAQKLKLKHTWLFTHAYLPVLLLHFHKQTSHTQRQVLEETHWHPAPWLWQ